MAHVPDLTHTPAASPRIVSVGANAPACIVSSFIQFCSAFTQFFVLRKLFPDAVLTVPLFPQNHSNHITDSSEKSIGRPASAHNFILQKCLDAAFYLGHIRGRLKTGHNISLTVHNELGEVPFGMLIESCLIRSPPAGSASARRSPSPGRKRTRNVRGNCSLRCTDSDRGRPYR